MEAPAIDDALTRPGQAGSTLDDFLAGEGIPTEATEHAVNSVLAWQIAQTMVTLHLSKAEMARRMSTGRAQLDRLLDPANGSVTLATLSRAATVFGRRLWIELD